MVYSPSDLQESAWAYNPWLSANAVILAFMSLSFIIQVYQLFHYRTWGFSLFFIAGLFLEILGYAGRVWAHNNVIDMNPFMLQIVCLTMAPVFFAGGIYLTLGKIVRVCSLQLSYLRPIWYTYIFFTADIISVALQGAGGALTSIGANDDDDPERKMMHNGIYITRAGLVFQVFSLVVFISLAGTFYLRCYRHSEFMERQYEDIRKGWRFRTMIVCLIISTLTIFTRCVYRVYELSGEWGSPAMSDQVAFLILEGIMIVIAVFVLNVGHPGLGFKGVDIRTRDTPAPKETKTVDPESV